MGDGPHPWRAGSWPPPSTAQVGEQVRLAVNTAEARLFDKDGASMTPLRRRAIAGMATAAQ